MTLVHLLVINAKVAMLTWQVNSLRDQRQVYQVGKGSQGKVRGVGGKGIMQETVGFCRRRC